MKRLLTCSQLSCPHVVGNAGVSQDVVGVFVLRVPFGVVVSNLVVCNSYFAEALWCALLRPFALICGLALICVFLRPTAFRTTAPRLGTAEKKIKQLPPNSEPQPAPPKFTKSVF